MARTPKEIEGDIIDLEDKIANCMDMLAGLKNELEKQRSSSETSKEGALSRGGSLIVPAF